MMGIGMSGGVIRTIRDAISGLFDPEARRQRANDRDEARCDKALSEQIRVTTNPEARAMLVKILIAISERQLPEPSNYRLLSASGFAREQVNDTRIDSLTPSQERNVFERTSRRASFMKMCIGTGAVFTAYIQEHDEIINGFIQPADITTKQLRETLLIIGNGVKATSRH